MKSFILKLTFLLAILILSSVAVQAQTTMGKDFYLSVGRNGVTVIGSLNLQVRLVASRATTVTGTFAGGSGLNFTATLVAGEVRTINLTEAQRTAVYSRDTGRTSKSLRIQSTEPISVYVLSQALGTTDATNVLPVDALGKEYYQISYAPYNASADAREDGYTVVATESGTDVSENGTLKTTLSAGQVYSFYYTGDMTGRRITASKPVAYFVSNSSAHIPGGSTIAADCLFQQLMSVDRWGKNFFVPPTRRGIERVRIVASENGTTISQTGGSIITGSLSLSKGQFIELEIKLTSRGCYIASNKPIGVCSYLPGYAYSGLTEQSGDPAIAWIPPVEQFVNLTTIAPFVPLNNSVLTNHYALIIAATATRDQTIMALGNSTTFTGLSGGSWTTGVGTPSYSFYSIPLTNQSYTFANPAGLAIMGYGLGTAESYYYLAGSAARDLLAAFFVNGEHYLDVDGKKFCGIYDFHITAQLENVNRGIAGYLKWFINGTEQLSARDDEDWTLTLTAGSTNTIRMDVIDLNGDTHSYSTTISLCKLLLPINPHKLI
ncbi:MAG: IgGFc-binding protein, partial [Dysgonamonadaceae bacterium]|nr:IgGFc-binding protein [Dysgonamonadaceae bacterium]